MSEDTFDDVDAIDERDDTHRGDETHDTAMFDIILEVAAIDTGEFFRVLAAFEYLPEEKKLRLVTLH